MATTKTKRKQIEQTEAKTILESVKDIKIHDVVSQVNNLQVTVQKNLADLCATVTTKVQQMEQLDAAIALKDDRLQELYDIEKEAISLDEMRSQREQERQDWEQERQVREKRWQEEENEHAKSRNRKEDEWKYDFEQKKRRIQEEFESEVQRNKRNEQVRHETLERNWLERENLLLSKESELKALQAQSAGFEERLAEATRKAETTGFSLAKSKYEHEIALSKKDAEGEKKVADMKILSLGSQIEGLINQIEDLQKNLISARQDAKEVASEALKSASSRQLAETLQKVVTDTTPSNKTK